MHMDTKAVSQKFSVLFVCLLFAACADKREASNAEADNETPGTAAAASASDYEAGLSYLYDAKDRFDYAKAVEHLEKAAVESSADPRARFALIYAYVLRSQYEKADALLRSAQASWDALEEKDALWLEALTARIEDDSDKEVAAWAVVTDAYPDDHWAWYQRAVPLMLAERHAEAAASMSRALALEPDPQAWSASWIYYLYSKALFRNGDYEAAAAAAAPGKATPATWRATFFREALARVKAGEADRIEEFVEEYRRVSKEEGRIGERVTETNIAAFYYEIGEYQKAVDQLQRARKAEEKDYIYSQLGYNLTFMRETKDALEVTEEGVAKFPESSAVWAARGWALYTDRQLEAAREALIRARSLSQRNSYRIERDLATVEAAINAESPTIPAYIPWLG